MSNNTDLDLETITANLHIVREQAKELEAAVHEMEDRLKAARGTGDHTVAAAAAVEVTRTKRKYVKRDVSDPGALIEGVIRGASLNSHQISRLTNLSAGKVSMAMRILRATGKVINVGSEDFPKWTLRVGDNTSTTLLTSEVKRLIEDRPMTTQELLETTGARLSRVSGALVALQRDGNQLLNLGTQRRAKWFMVKEGVAFSKVAAREAVSEPTEPHNPSSDDQTS